MGNPPGERGRRAAPVPDAIAAIDIGTNSVHMVLARPAGPDGSRFEVITRLKEMVRLGSGRGEMKELEPDAVDRGVAALARCRALADSWSAPVYAVATSAVREARNAPVFIQRARAEAGVEVNVISGVEEARLIQLGVLQALPVFDRRLVLVDVGGGSTEVLFGRGDHVDGARSVKLGSLRMTRKFFPDGVVGADAVARCRRHVAAKLAPLAHELGHLGHEVAVASSGTAETLAAMAFARKGGEVPQNLNGAVLGRRALGKVIDDLAAARTVEERRRLPGMDPARADILLGGAIVLEQVCDALGIEALTISEYALREGVLLDALHRLGGGTLHHLSDLRRASVFHLMELCDDDPTHSVHVSRLALQLHDRLADRLGLDEADRELLEAAALLCHVGLFVAHSAHHKHSYYVIRSTEHLMGFTDGEIEVIAQVARYHRKSPPSAAKHPEFAALGDADRHRVAAMSALLRIAIALDRNHEQAVDRVDVAEDPSGDGLVLVLDGRNGADLSLERWSATDAASVLSTLLGTDISVECAPPLAG